jgi:glycosyltransferase involved in cell wall biosynthesis
MTLNSKNCQLVTIYCALYNHERYAFNSITSMLNQDYPNLQIIISDDCSTDKTYEIAEKLVNEYKGSHQVILRRNSINLGVIKHVEILLSLSKGNWIFQAAGDDVSYLARVSDTMNYIDKLPVNIKGVFTNLYIIDEDNNKRKLYFDSVPNCAKNIKEYKSGLNCWAIGASLCFHRIVYDKYGDFVKNVIGEDGCLAFRVLLEGGMEYFDCPTVYYRIHNNNLSQNLTIKQKVNFKNKEQWLHINHLKDAELSRRDCDFKNKIRKKIVKAFLINWLLNTKLVNILYLYEKIKIKL